MGLRFLSGICLLLAALASVRAAPVATVRIIAQLGSEPKIRIGNRLVQQGSLGVVRVVEFGVGR